MMFAELALFDDVKDRLIQTLFGELGLHDEPPVSGWKSPRPTRCWPTCRPTYRFALFVLPPEAQGVLARYKFAAPNLPQETAP